MNANELIAGFKNQEIRFLSKAITFCESKKLEHLKIIEEFHQKFPSDKYAKIIGFSGLPGVGKSTLINNFTQFLSGKNLKVAILAIDPSSTISGGSILGDKTRMVDISADDNIFIRPSATDGVLGGVASKTYEAIKLCEKFGFDYIFVESVGVGQSESLLSKMVDYFVLLLAPGTGDDLQGMKRGILEHADLLIINKADGDRVNEAKNTLHLYEQSFDLVSKDSHDFKALLGTHESEKFLKDLKDECNKYFKKYSIKDQRKKMDEHFSEELVRHFIHGKLDQFLKKNPKLSLLNALKKFKKEL